MSRYTLEYWDDIRNRWQVYDNQDDPKKALKLAMDASKKNVKVRVYDNRIPREKLGNKTKTIATFYNGKRVTKPVKEMTGTGAVGAYSTPFAFKTKKPVSSKKSVNETTAPEWEYTDNGGNKHRGHIQKVSDRGGTDVTYFFIDKNTGELTLINGPRVKTQAKRVNTFSEPHQKYFGKREGINEAVDKAKMGKTLLQLANAVQQAHRDYAEMSKDRERRNQSISDGNRQTSIIRKIAMGLQSGRNVQALAAELDDLTLQAIDNHNRQLADFLVDISRGKTEVNEGGDPYYAWRNDETMSPKQKIGNAISEINRQLAEMNRVVKRSARLKREMGMSANDYWKRTNNAFVKMEQRMHKISQKLRELRQ